MEGILLWVCWNGLVAFFRKWFVLSNFGENTEMINRIALIVLFSLMTNFYFGQNEVFSKFEKQFKQNQFELIKKIIESPEKKEVEEINRR